MADELEPVTQTFEADVEDYVAEVQAAADEAKHFADANGEVTLALDSVRDHATEAGMALGSIRDGAVEADGGADALRDGAIEAAEALGHLRDEAIEASVAMNKLRDSEVEAGGAGAAAEAGGMSMMVLGITALIGLAAAVAPALLAAGAGIGAFGLFAYPAIKQVIGALGDTHAQLAKLPEPVQQAVAGVKSLEGEFTKLSKAFAPEAFSLFNQALKIASDLLPKLVPLAEEGGQALQGLMSAIGSGLNSKGFSDFLSMLDKLVVPATQALTRLAGTVTGILGNALTQLAPMAVPMINMLNDLLKAAGPALAGGLQFLAQVVLDLGRAITPLLGPLGKMFAYLDDHPVFAQIAAGIVGIVVAVKAWSVAMGILDAVMDANPFVLIGLALVALAILIATHTHQIAEAFDKVRHAIATAGHDIASTFDTVRHTVASWGHDIATAFDTARHAVATVGHDIAVGAQTIIAGLTLAVNWIASHWKQITAWLVDPVGMAVHEIMTHTHDIAQAFDNLRHDVAAILAGARHDIATTWDNIRHDASAAVAALRHDVATAFDNLRHDIAAIADAIPGDIEHAWDIVRHDAAAMGDDVLHALETAWNNVKTATSTAIKDVLSFFQKLPGQIISFLAGLPGQMLTAGRNIIDGLIHGIESAAADIPGIMKSLASNVASYFTDPLKIFSPSRVFFEHGVNIVQGAIDGVKATAPQLLAAMRGLGTGVATQGIGSSLAAGAIAPAGSSSVHVTVPMTVQGSAGAAYNDPAFRQYLQQQVQEATLRYGQLNPGNGLTPAWGR